MSSWPKVDPRFMYLPFQWPLLEEATGLLAYAPDDEVMAEILVVQSELAQQVGTISCCHLSPFRVSCCPSLLLTRSYLSCFICHT